MVSLSCDAGFAAEGLPKICFILQTRGEYELLYSVFF